MKPGVTLLEIVVVLAIIAILLALIFPAIQFSRESARRTQCASNLHQIVVAVQQYEQDNRMYPIPGGRESLHVSLLPYLEQEPVHERIQHLRRSGIPLQEDAIMGVVILVYLCPSDGAAQIVLEGKAATNYAGCIGSGALDNGYDGVFVLKQASILFPQGKTTISAGSIVDGTSQTAAVSEILVANHGQADGRVIFNTRSFYSQRTEFELFCTACIQRDYQSQTPPGGEAVVFGEPYSRGRPWAFGGWGKSYCHALPPGSPSCFNHSDTGTGIYSAYSNHSRMVQVAFLDGHTASVNNSVDTRVWRAFGSRAGGE